MILIVTIFFVCFLSLASTGQNIEVVYTSRETPNYFTSGGYSTSNEIDITNFSSLIINGKVSYYRNDSMIVNKFPSKMRMTLYQSETWKSYDNDTHITVTPKHPRGYGEIESLSAMFKRNNNNWKLIEGEKNIANFKCKKAENLQTGAVAWYADKIPYPDGPIGFCIGLPGLVLSYESTGYIIEAAHINDSRRTVEIPNVMQLTPKMRSTNRPLDTKQAKSSQSIEIGPDTPIGVALTYDSF